MKKKYTDTLGETLLEEETKEIEEVDCKKSKSKRKKRKLSINTTEARGCTTLL